MTEKRGEIVRKLEEIEPIMDVCGEIKVLSSTNDFPEASLALAIMRAPTITHYHEDSTEFYFVIGGKGKLIVAENTYKPKEGMLAIIPPNTAHYTIPREITKVLAFSVPAWIPEDQFVLEEKDTLAGYSPSKERFELIEEILFQNGLELKEGISQREREELDIKRQDFILRAGLNNRSLPELREFLRIF